ncbi:MAG: tRNA lysidine(34) synthetase TilS [Blautia sp.]|nr:tRNA lysidine(34) synthetase TilS [Blautia sp.]
MDRGEIIYRKAASFTVSNGLLPENAFVAAGVSGGSDSVVMLHILLRMAENMDMELHVIHVNHGIRGEEAVRDEDFVKSLCKKRGIPFALFEYDVPSMSAEQHMSLEEAGRMARRMAFREFREQNGIPEQRFRIALAHNRDDLCETVLHNLARGTGLRGLCSMKPSSGEIIRPVLALSKDEINRYAEENGLAYITDSTNLCDDYTRNRIRKHVMPYLTEHVNLRAAEHIAEVSGLASQAVEYMEKKAHETLERCLEEETDASRGEMIFLGMPFLMENPALQPYVIMEALERTAGRRKDFTMRHIRDVLDISNGNTGRSADLPYGVTAVREKGGLCIRKKETVPLLHRCIKSRIVEYCGQEIIKNRFEKWFDNDKITEEVVFRTRQAGDYMVIHPDGKRKKLTRVMIDDGIPSDIRDVMPLAAAGSHVLWIAGGRASEGFRVGSGTKNILELYIDNEICNQ